MKTYQEPGRGRKQCDKCKIYVHVRASHCPECDFIFNANAYDRKQDKENAEPKVYDEAGRGRKQCNKCNKYVGCKSNNCPACGAEFTTEQISKLEQFSSTKEFKFKQSLGYPTYKGIFTPVGKFKKPKSKSDEDIKKWIDDIYVNTNEQYILYPSAIRYLLRQTYPDKIEVVDQWEKQYATKET